MLRNWISNKGHIPVDVVEAFEMAILYEPANSNDYSDRLLEQADCWVYPYHAPTRLFKYVEAFAPISGPQVIIEEGLGLSECVGPYQTSSDDNYGRHFYDC